MGRWLPSSNDLLEYIKQQLLGFSQGMATKMIRNSKFTNMEGSENHTGKEFHTVYGGRYYHTSSLHLHGNWAHHKDCVPVPFHFVFLLLPKKTSLFIAPTRTRDIAWCPGLTQPHHHNVTLVYLRVSSGCTQCTTLSGGPHDIRCRWVTFFFPCLNPVNR